MVESNKVNDRNRQGLTLRMNMKMFNENNLPHELLLTTRQKTKLKNSVESNMSTDILISCLELKYLN